MAGLDASLREQEATLRRQIDEQAAELEQQQAELHACRAQDAALAMQLRAAHETLACAVIPVRERALKRGARRELKERVTDAVAVARTRPESDALAEVVRSMLAHENELLRTVISQFKARLAVVPAVAAAGSDGSDRRRWASAPPCSRRSFRSCASMSALVLCVCICLGVVC
jgi:hypothetical protein